MCFDVGWGERRVTGADAPGGCCWDSERGSSRYWSRCSQRQPEITDPNWHCARGERARLDGNDLVVCH
jgi:hypothetical protein